MGKTLYQVVILFQDRKGDYFAESTTMPGEMGAIFPVKTLDFHIECLREKHPGSKVVAFSHIIFPWPQ